MSNGARERATTSRRSRNNASPPGADPPPRLSIPDEPPKVPRRPPSKGNKRETLADIAKRIPVQLMRQYFNYPLRSAAEAMHISVTTLKRLCRRHGVKRWPHRQISGINRALNDLEAQHQVARDGEVGAVADQLRQLHRRREVIIELAFESDDEGSRKSFSSAPPPAAHKRGHRTSASSDSSASSSSRSRAGSVASVPESPGSATSVDESKPTSAWWQHTPGIEEPTTAAVVTPVKAASSGASRPRRSSPGAASASSRGRAPRTQRSSAMFGNIPRPGKARANTQHRRKSSNGNSGATANTTTTATAAAGSGGSARRYSSSSPSSSSLLLPGAAASVSRTSVGSGGMEALPSCQLSPSTATTGGRSGGGGMFESSAQFNQQSDDLATLGDLLFGPDELVAAHPGLFSHNSLPWTPGGPFCPTEVLLHDQSLMLGAPSPFSNEHVFSHGLTASALNWGGIGGDRNSLGVPIGGVGPL